MIFLLFCEVPDLEIVGRIFWSIAFGQVAPN